MWRLTKMWLISPTGISHRELNPSLSASRQAPCNTPHEHPRNTCGANGGTDANDCEECAHRARRRQRARRYPAYHEHRGSGTMCITYGSLSRSCCWGDGLSICAIRFSKRRSPLITTSRRAFIFRIRKIASPLISTNPSW